MGKTHEDICASTNAERVLIINSLWVTHSVGTSQPPSHPVTTQWLMDKVAVLVSYSSRDKLPEPGQPQQQKYTLLQFWS